MKRRDFISMVPDRDTWPTVNVSELPRDRLELFNHRYKAINMYIDGEPIRDIETTTEISYKILQQLLNKCIEPGHDGRIKGYRALIPFLVRSPYKRTVVSAAKPLGGQGGFSGLLRQVLNKYPSIEDYLKKLILKRNSPERNVHEKSIRAKDLHQAFLKKLKKAGIESDQWPFNTKHLGLRSIQNFMNEVLDESFGRSVNVRGERAAIAHTAVSTGYEAFLNFEEPYDAVELDAYSINAFFVAEFETPEGTVTEIQLQRIWLIALIEVISQAILSYSIVYRSEVSADDVVGVIRKAVNDPVREPLTIPGLIYPKDGGFPAEVIPQCKGAIWGCILLDGALAHLSQAVHTRARKALGFSINWGPVAHFERRPNIERFFSSVSTNVFMRLPSTTGSNPGKGRAVDAEKQSLKYKIKASDGEQLFAIYVAQYNATPSEGNSYNSPLEVLQHFTQNKGEHFLLRKLPIKPIGTILIPLLKVCTVRGGRANGRRPYIQFEGVRYTNSVLAQSSGLTGHKLTIEIDESDLRVCKAYLQNGSEFGTLQAGGRWYLTKHSLRTRKIINSLAYKKIITLLNNEDPIQIYMDYLSKSKKSKSKLNLNPQAATEAVRVALESGLKKKIHSTIEKNAQIERPIKDLKTPSSLMGPLPDLNQLYKNNNKA
ncbi:hypothetical protein GALL_193920 [mine drainage metagenome]|uniref:Integrase catalytic domain-containing protein n=1 Tax=mine drainage metagenome TaxID=410659 RepID=A0A1J5S347_9ZZZZ